MIPPYSKKRINENIKNLYLESNLVMYWVVVVAIAR